ncbi:uncharacterized protein LOC143020029 isoform X3 [Oratosquilla oratoria]|uniref:uncharacterized protein LOC143020029 isoform X3 n=1 Tax=Oratosquilla oratoria TaxID=337810 RepID=UPI003F758149
METVVASAPRSFVPPRPVPKSSSSSSLEAEGQRRRGEGGGGGWEGSSTGSISSNRRNSTDGATLSERRGFNKPLHILGEGVACDGRRSLGRSRSSNDVAAAGGGSGKTPVGGEGGGSASPASRSAAKNHHQRSQRQLLQTLHQKHLRQKQQILQQRSGRGTSASLTLRNSHRNASHPSSSPRASPNATPPGGSPRSSPRSSPRESPRLPPKHSLIKSSPSPSSPLIAKVHRKARRPHPHPHPLKRSATSKEFPSCQRQELAENLSRQRHYSTEEIPEGWARLSALFPDRPSPPPPLFFPGDSLSSTSSSPSHHSLRSPSSPPPDCASFNNENLGGVSLPTSLSATIIVRSSSSSFSSLCSSESGKMSGTTGGGGSGSTSGGTTSSAPYQTIRRGLKATTSKLMNATSTVRRPSLPSANTERHAGGEKSADPCRFVEGVSFKGKLIGVLEVSEARGDRMCQEALAELKMAVRAAGEHKQKIVINVAMDGIRLRDERSGDCLYHHPVHKISFIAQDMTDTRAFGYIFGSPDAGHRFFGIKTEKAAGQVVIAMRDLFQDSHYGGAFSSNGDTGIVSASLLTGAGGPIADLLDLQSELSSLQKGLSEISQRSQQLKESDSAADPFGDSFKPTFPPPDPNKPPRLTASTAPTPAPLAPPPVSGRSRHDSHHSQQSNSSGGDAKFGVGAEQRGKEDGSKFAVDFDQTGTQQQHGLSHEDRYAAFHTLNANEPSYSAFSELRSKEGSRATSAASSQNAASAGEEPFPPTSGPNADSFDLQWTDLQARDSTLGSNRPPTLGMEAETPASSEKSGGRYDVFTELDPLGTGRVRPYIDKKDFFNDIRKPAKRVLRDLTDGEGSSPCSPRTQPGLIPPEVSALVASTSLYSTRSDTITSSHPQTSTETTPVHSSSIAMQPFTDSFSPPADAFAASDLQTSVHTEERDPFDTSNFPASNFADFSSFGNESPRSQRSEMSSSIPDEPVPQVPCGPLTVALPPESFRDSPPPPFSPPPPPLSRSPARTGSAGSGSPQLQRPYQGSSPRGRLSKQVTVAASYSVSPKTLPRSHKFHKQSSFESDWDSGVVSHHKMYASGELTPPTPPRQQSEGGLSPRPRPRSSLSKHISNSSAALSLRPSNSRYSDDQFSSPEVECRPFPNSEMGMMGMSAEEAPEPPPRPAHVEPPPLPPKRQPTHVTLKPPPRPPPSLDSHYNYINEYDSSPSPEAAKSLSPPIPIPARKPRYPESSTLPVYMPSRSSKPTHTQESCNFQFPKTSFSPTHEVSGAIPKTSSRDSTPSKSTTPGKSPRVTPRLATTGSVDLANTSLDQLAASLDVPVERLARMTVVELAACLAQMQLKQSVEEEEEPEPSPPASQFKPQTGRRRDFAQDDDDMFAKFDEQFPKSPVDTPEFDEMSSGSQGCSHLEAQVNSAKSLGAPVSEDRYAVFRELTSAGKQKSVFDENFLTPQNSMEEEVSEVSSGTFKANFENSTHQDSVEHRSSLSDDNEVELEKDKDWSGHEMIDHEGVTIFRSPEISEYDNFEPNFDAKFDDDFSTATISEKSDTPVAGNSPAHMSQPSPRSSRREFDSQKSPFTDDFSPSSKSVNALSESSLTSKSKTSETSSSFAKFDDNFLPPPSGGDKYAVFRELYADESHTEVRKSPFEDNFVAGDDESQGPSSGFSCNFATSENLDDPFTNTSGKTRSVSQGSVEFTSQSPFEGNEEESLKPPPKTKDKRKSPFDDDFTDRGDRYEVLREVESEREPSLEGEVGKLTKQSEHRGSPFDDSWHGSHRNTPHDDQKSVASMQSIQEEYKNVPHESPFEDDFSRELQKSSEQDRVSRSGSEHGKSPFSETFTPPASNRSFKGRGPSRLSAGSEGSEFRQSPFDDNFNSAISSVVEEASYDNVFPSFESKESQGSETVDKSSPDPFSIQLASVGSAVDDQPFADFESAFKDEESHSTPPPLQSSPTSAQHSLDDDVFPTTDAEFKICPRFLKPEAEMKKSDSVNIFRRSSDPFADEFFTDESVNNAEQQQGGGETKIGDDPFWEEPFETFNFQPSK